MNPRMNDDLEVIHEDAGAAVRVRGVRPLRATVLLTILTGCVVIVAGFGVAILREDESKVVLPEDPCALLREDEVAAAVNAPVSKVERTPSVEQVVAAQRRAGDAAVVPVGDERLCLYTTTSPFETVIVFVPGPSDGGTEEFDAGRRDGTMVEHLGDGAYLLGGTLDVLASRNAMFSISVGYPDVPGVATVLKELGRLALDRLT